MTTLQHHKEQDALVLTPDGSIATSDVRALLRAANRLVKEHPRGMVVLDLSLVRLPGLETIDAVMRLHLIAKRRGRPLQITAHPGAAGARSTAGRPQRHLAAPRAVPLPRLHGAVVRRTPSATSAHTEGLSRGCVTSRTSTKESGT